MKKEEEKEGEEEDEEEDFKKEGKRKGKGSKTNPGSAFNVHLQAQLNAMSRSLNQAHKTMIDDVIMGIDSRMKEDEFVIHMDKIVSNKPDIQRLLLLPVLYFDYPYNGNSIWGYALNHGDEHHIHTILHHCIMYLKLESTPDKLLMQYAINAINPLLGHENLVGILARRRMIRTIHSVVCALNETDLNIFTFLVFKTETQIPLSWLIFSMGLKVEEVNMIYDCCADTDSGYTHDCYTGKMVDFMIDMKGDENLKYTLEMPSNYGVVHKNSVSKAQKDEMTLEQIREMRIAELKRRNEQIMGRIKERRDESSEVAQILKKKTGRSLKGLERLYKETSSRDSPEKRESRVVRNKIKTEPAVFTTKTRMRAISSRKNDYNPVTSLTDRRPDISHDHLPDADEMEITMPTLGEGQFLDQ